MSTTTPTIASLSDLFPPQEIEGIDKAPLQSIGTRHPTWFALCSIAFGGVILRFGAPVAQAELAVDAVAAGPS